MYKNYDSQLGRVKIGIYFDRWTHYEQVFILNTYLFGDILMCTIIYFSIIIFTVLNILPILLWLAYFVSYETLFCTKVFETKQVILARFDTCYFILKCLTS